MTRTLADYVARRRMRDRKPGAPRLPRTISIEVVEGHVLLGSIVEGETGFDAFDANDDFLGRLSSHSEAMASIRTARRISLVCVGGAR